MSSDKGGLYCNLMGIESPRKDVKSLFFLGYDATGEAYVYGGKEWPALPEAYELTKQFMALTEDLLEEGKLKLHPAGKRSGGLEGIVTGMEELKSGKVSGEKLVYRIGIE